MFKSMAHVAHLYRLSVTHTLLLLGILFSGASMADGGNNKTQNMPSNSEIFSWVRDIVSFGPRRTGSEAGINAAAYIESKFKSFGLEDVSIVRGNAMQWDAKKWSLTVNGKSIPAFYMPRSFHPKKPMPIEFTTGEQGLNAEVIYVGDSINLEDFDVEGKIVVADVNLHNLEFGKDGFFSSRATYVYDPEVTLPDSSHPVPFLPANYPHNYVSAMDHGAVAFVGILKNYLEGASMSGEDIAYMVREDAYLEIPGLWVGPNAGKQLKKILMDDKNSKATVELEGEMKEVSYNVVVGYLPGMSDETIMVQSHHDSAFDGAIQDASGSAEVLALAKYYGGFDKSKRERRMMFVTMDTHYTEYEAHEDFVRDFIKSKNHKNIVANVTIEHVAKEMILVDGKGVLTGEVEPRMFIVSDNTELLSATEKAISKNDYKRSLIVPGSNFGDDLSDGIPTDADFVYRAGVPVVSLLTAPLYIYDIADTLDKVAYDELNPTAVIFSDIIDDINTMSKDSLLKFNP